MTYDPTIDKFWVADFGGRLIQFDPSQGFARTFEVFLPNSRTCLASVPVP
jgi:hypothetical protein